MSTTMGLAYCAMNGVQMFDELTALAEKYGYGLLDGLEAAEVTVRPGLKVMKENEGWVDLHLLQSPSDSTAGLAHGIHEELIALETNHTTPKYFGFLFEATAILSDNCSKIGFFFSGEWHAEDRVRYSYGTIDRLIATLSLAGNWETRYMIPATGRLQDSDDTPFVFELAGLGPQRRPGMKA